MAPKRVAKKAAAPPPPPPPQEESSDETRSGSRSRSDDSEEDEEAIADSPVPAATPALKSAPAPSQKGEESESSEEEDEEDDDEEEEEEPVPAPPKNQPPTPQKKEASDASGSDDDEEEDDDAEEEEEPTRAAPPSAPKKQSPQPEKKEDSDTSGDEGESEDEEEEEAPPPKPAPKKDAAALKPPPPAAAADTKKTGAVQRIWSTDDEVRILEAVAAHKKQHGTFPQPEALMDVLAGKLDNPAYGSKELHSKVGSLRTRYLTLSKRGELPSKEHDRRILDLGKMVWDSDKTTPAAAGASAANSHERKGFEEMCELYPCLAEEVKAMEAARPGFCKREFGKMDDDKARAMDEKIKKQRVAQIRVEMRRSDLLKEVTKALIDLVDA